MMRNFTQMLIVALLFVLSTTTNAQESVLLKYGFKAGTTFLQETEVLQNTVQSMMGQEMKVIAEIKAVNGFNVESLSPEGNATVLMTVKDISIHTVAMGRDTSMQYSDLKDAARIVFSPEGNVVSTAKVDSSEAASVVNQLETGNLIVLPGKEVKIGESWDETKTEVKQAAAGAPFALEMAIDNKYTLAGKENRNGKEYFKITSSGTVALNGKGSQMGMEMFIEGNAKVEGYSLFDPIRQMIVYTENDTEMEMSIAISGPQNMTVPMTQSIKTIVRVK